MTELADLAGSDLSGLDLHRPFVDDVSWACPSAGCHGTVRRLAPVLDAWFDSGSMPSAQRHHPFADDVTGPAGPDTLPTAFPADFICEAIDQTRGWFYSLLAVNTLVFGRTPYRNVVCLGHIVDEDGQKMSKSKGNVIDPWQLFDRVGADGLRWYFFSAGQPWGQRRVFEEGIRESTRQTLLTLWNVFSFFVTYADLDGWRPAAEVSGGASPAPVVPGHVLDRWVLGELDATVAEVTEALDGFDALRGATRLARFVDDLSNWYVRRSRPRFWKASDPAAHATLHHALVVTAQLLAPFCPFLADELYVALTGESSVHLSDWPVPAARPEAERATLSAEMDAARRLVALGRAARTDAKVKVRQPLSRALVLHPGVALGPDVVAEIATELNVKAVDDVDTLSGLMSWTIVPNFRALGPRLGPRVNEVKAALAEADGSALQRQLETDGYIEVAGERLTADDVEVRAARHEAFALAEEGGWAVALDLELDDDLRREGLAREIVRGINDLRKEMGLAVSDRIALTIEADGAVGEAVAAHRDYIAAEVLAVELELGAAGAGSPRAHRRRAPGPGRRSSAADVRQRRRPKRVRSLSALSGSNTALPHSLGRLVGSGALPGAPLPPGGAGGAGAGPRGSSTGGPATRTGVHGPRASPPTAKGTGWVGGPRSGGTAGGSCSDATCEPGAKGGATSAGPRPLAPSWSAGWPPSGSAAGDSSGAGRSTSASATGGSGLSAEGSSSRRCISVMPDRSWLRCSSMRRVSTSRSDLSLSRFDSSVSTSCCAADPCRVGAAAGLGLGLGAGARGLFPGLAEHPVGLLLRLLDGGVGRALGQHQGAAQRLVGLGHLGYRGRWAAPGLVELALGLDQAGLGGVGASLRLTHALVELAHAPGDALDEVVDVAGVVAAPPCLTELDGVERLRSQFHARESNENSAPAWGQGANALVSK